MKKLLLMSVAAFVFASPAAFADNHGGGERDPAKKFAEADSDGNGTISKDEFMQKHEERATKHFEKIDADGSGDLSQDELKEGRKKMREGMREKIKERRGSKDSE